MFDSFKSILEASKDLEMKSEAETISQALSALEDTVSTADGVVDNYARQYVMLQELGVDGEGKVVDHTDEPRVTAARLAFNQAATKVESSWKRTKALIDVLKSLQVDVSVKLRSTSYSGGVGLPSMPDSGGAVIKLPALSPKEKEAIALTFESSSIVNLIPLDSYPAEAKNREVCFAYVWYQEATGDSPTSRFVAYVVRGEWRVAGPDPEHVNYMYFCGNVYLTASDGTQARKGVFNMGKSKLAIGAAYLQQPINLSAHISNLQFAMNDTLGSFDTNRGSGRMLCGQLSLQGSRENIQILMKMWWPSLAVRFDNGTTKWLREFVFEAADYYTTIPVAAISGMSGALSLPDSLLANGNFASPSATVWANVMHYTRLATIPALSRPTIVSSDDLDGNAQALLFSFTGKNSLLFDGLGWALPRYISFTRPDVDASDTTLPCHGYTDGRVGTILYLPLLAAGGGEESVGWEDVTSGKYVTFQQLACCSLELTSDETAHETMVSGAAIAEVITPRGYEAYINSILSAKF